MNIKKTDSSTFISGKSFIVIVAIISIMLSFGTIFSGFDIDDYIQRTYILGSEKLQEKGLKQAEGNVGFTDAAMHYFTFFNPKEEGHIQSMKEFGNVPWWFYDGAQLSFFRPVTSMTHWLDYQLWPDSPMCMHIHNLFWATLLVISVALVYRRFLGANYITLLATFLYIIDISRFRPVEWIANRNALIATFFGFIALLLHDSWRKGKGNKYAVLAPAVMAISVLSAEAGIGTMAFLCAYALFLDEEKKWSGKLLSLAPYFGVIITWRVVYKFFEFGARHTRMYIDPIKDPGEFITALFERAPILLTGQFIGFDNFAMSFSLPATKRLIFICIAIIIALFILFWPLLRRDKTARFWGLAMILAVVPVCAYGVQQGRLLSFAAIGGFGLVAQLIFISFNEEKRNKIYSGLKQIPAYLGTYFFIITLLIVQLIAITSIFVIAFTNGDKINHITPGFVRTNVGIDKEIENKTVVVINAPDAFRFVYLPFERDYFKQPIPDKIRILSPSISPITITRVDAKTLILKPDAGFLPDTRKPLPGAPIDLPDVHGGHTIHKIIQGYRDERNPMKVGDKYNLSDLTIEIIAITDDGLPTEAKFTFNKNLEDDSFRWLYCDWDVAYKVMAQEDVSDIPGVIPQSGFRKFNVPAIGESVTIKGPFY